jgi:hypothetical protein
MRYVGAISLVLAALFGVGLIITSGQANAATSVSSPPVVPPPGGATLTQGSAGTWTASVYLDTVALCDDTFNLVTSAPDTDNPAKPVTYDGTATAPCGAAQQAKDGALTMVGLTFPSMPGGAIPQTATLAVTPSATALAAGAAPVEFPLTVRRQLTGASSLWTPAWFGLGFVLALVALVASIGVKTTDNRRVHGMGPKLLGATLYAPAAWTFGGSWATNFTALGTVIGGVLAATGAVAGIVPGVDLSRIGLLFAIFGVFAVIAPLVFATLNTRLSGAPPAGGDGDVPVTKAWIMLLASSFTAFGMGASLGLIGWVLTYKLVVAPWLVRLCVGIGIAVVGALFLGNVCASILNMGNRSQKSAAQRAETVGSAVTVGPTVTVGPVVPAAPAAPIARASRPSLL